MTETAPEDRPDSIANPYLGKTREELTGILIEWGMKVPPEEEEMFMAAWAVARQKPAPALAAGMEAGGPGLAAGQVCEETPHQDIKRTPGAAGIPWSLVPLEELDRYTPKEAYALLERLEKEIGIRPPKGYDLLTLENLKTWLREQITSDQVQVKGKALDERKREELRVARRKINLTGLRLRETTAYTYNTLVDENDPPRIFIRGGRPVRVTQDEKGMPSIESLTVTDLRHVVERTADYCKTGRDGIESVTPPPLDTVQDLLASRSWTDIPPLEGVIEVPLILPDGTVTALPGYNATLRVVYIPAPDLLVPAVPDRPGPEDLTQAVILLRGIVQDFPFSDEASRVNAIGLLLTAVLRPVIPGHVPLALIDKPQAGTGATLLAEVIAMVATGRPGAMMVAPANEAEWSKTITALLSQGRSVNIIDNVEGRLFAPSLAALLTGYTWKGRILGESTMIDLPNRSTWMATGNNIQMGGDLPRRCYWIRMDARQARPWQRTDFHHPELLTWVHQERGRILAAILTLARSWILAKRLKPVEVPPIGGFEKWRWWIGGILEHAGLKEFLGNLEQFHERSDTSTREWDAFVQALMEHFPKSFTVKDVIMLLEVERDDKQASFNEPETGLDEVLPEEIAVKRGDLRTVLGKAFAKRQDQVFPSGCVIEKDDRQTHHAIHWKIRKVDQK